MSDTQDNDMTVAEQTPDVQPRTADGRAIEAERDAGGVLVFAVETEQRRYPSDIDEARTGRELIGFAEVTSWSNLRASLARRGLGVGAIHTLETFEPREVGL